MKWQNIDLVHALKGEDGNAIITEVRLRDGFINATKLCQSAKKDWSGYYRNGRTKTYISELYNSIPNKCQLIEQGGSHACTWVHPYIAIDLARWCSPKFQVAISQLVRRYLSGEITTEESRLASQNAIQRMIAYDDTDLLISEYDRKPVVYLGTVITPEFTGIKVGHTDDILQRNKAHKNDFNGCFRFIKVYYSLLNEQAEKRILAECYHLGYRTRQEIFGKNQTELIAVSDDFPLERLIEIAERVVNNT